MKRSRPFVLTVYAAATSTMRPAAHLLLARRRAKGKEDAQRIGERRGIAGLPRPEGALFWLHAASVGEFMSILPLVEQIVARDIHVLVTTGTLTSAAIAAKRLPQGAIHQFVPLDIPTYVRRFLKHWQPDMALFAESEIWPNLMAAAMKRGIPLGIVNGRMSPRSYGRWLKMRRFISSLLGRLDFCLAQSEEDAVRFRALGASGVEAVGNLKFDSATLPVDKTALSRVRAVTDHRPVWLAASTHEGEEELIIAAHIALAKKFRRLMTIIVPRHPDRGPAIVELIRTKFLSVRQRSRGEEPNILTDIYLADTMGELGLFYRAAPIALVGASLVEPGGGHNPIEPAQLNTALLHGPYIGNQVEIYEKLVIANASQQVRSVSELVDALDTFFGDPALIQSAADRAKQTVMQLGGGLNRTIVLLEPYLLQRGVLLHNQAGRD